MKRILLAFAALMTFVIGGCKEEESYKASLKETLITSIFPAAGTGKMVITINGRNFSPNRTENEIKFNGIDAIVLDASSSKLQVVVPEGGESGNITLRIKGQEIPGPKFTYLAAEANYIVSTIAGSTTFGFVDGNGVEARFRNPDGVMIDRQGNIIITDRTNHSIRKMTPLGVVTTIAGTGQTGFADGKPGMFKTPWQSALDNAGNIIVVEKDGARIRKVSPDGVVSTVAGTGVTGFADGPAASARFNNALDAEVDAAGNIYVVDRDNRRIRKISPDGIVSTLAGNGTTAVLKNPLSIAIDARNNIIIVDGNNIKKITQAGEITVIAGTGVKGFDDGTPGQPQTAKLGDIFGITFDKGGNLLMADASNNRIRMIKAGPGGDLSTGTVVTIAGTGTAGRIDGLANAANFNNPYDVVVDAQGSIYVADNLNNSIRKITLR